MAPFCNLFIEHPSYFWRGASRADLISAILSQAMYACPLNLRLTSTANGMADFDEI